MPDVLPRITGSEMEWSVSIPSGDAAGGIQLDAATFRFLVEQYLRTVPHIGDFYSSFLGNGALLKIDSGDHPEYSTPEDTSIEGTVANEIASERIMKRILDQVVETGSTPIALRRFSLNRRVTDEGGRTWGYHENYCSSAGSVEISEASLALLGVHLATRNILVGAGFLDRLGRYYLAQKAIDCQTDFSLNTTSKKPLVNLRDEPHADPKRWRRVHVISGDPNMSPWATRMKFGTTSLVLRLIEHGMEPDVSLLSKLYLVGIDVARDTNLRRRYPVATAYDFPASASAAEIQMMLLTAAKQLAKEVALPEEELWTIEEWERACADVMQDPRLLANRSDWVLKMQTLERYRDRHGLPWSSPLLRRKDRQWDNIGLKGIGLALRNTTWAQWMPPEDLIKERVIIPPDTTRAWLRGMFVVALSANRSAFVNWGELSYLGNYLPISDPYMTHDELIDGLVEKKMRNQEVRSNINCS